MTKQTVRIKIMSDLHMEFGTPMPCHDRESIEQYDIFIMAGDISNSNNPDKNSPKLLKKLANFIFPKKLLYVTGNHDYYNSSRKAVDATLIELEKETENFIFLNHKIINIMDINFTGCTGWQYGEDYIKAQYLINDFNKIKDHEENIQQWGKEDYNFLRKSLSKLKKLIVVTHIPPCSFSLDLQHTYFQRHEDLIYAYFNNYEDLIKEYEPLLWCCGHMHDSFNDTFHKTKILRNAYGYHHDLTRRNFNFNEDIIININIKYRTECIF